MVHKNFEQKINAKKKISANCKAITKVIACVANPSETHCNLCTSRKKCKYFQCTNSYLNLCFKLLSFFIFMNVSCIKDDLIPFNLDFGRFRK